MDFGALQMRFGAKLDAAGFGEVNNALKQIADNANRAKDSQTGLEKGAKNLERAYQALAASAAVYFLRSAVIESRNATQETFLLQNRVESLGLSWADNEKKLSTYLDTIEELTRFEKGEAIPALNILIDKTRDLDDAQRLLVDAMGLSVATGMSLAEASSLVAGAHQGMQRDVMGLAKVLGINRNEIKTNSQVLEELHRRFGDLAISGDKMADGVNKLSDAWKGFKTTVGDEIKPLVEWLSTNFARLLDEFGYAFRRLSVDVQILISWMRTFAEVTVAAGRHSKEAWDKALADGRKRYEDLKKLNDDITADRDKYREEKESGAQKELEVEAAIYEKKRMMAKDTFAAIASAAQQSAAIIGEATVAGLQGDVKSWKNAARQIVDIVIRQAQAVVMARAIEGAAAEVASKGVVGIAAGAAAIAWGAAQVAALAALGQVIKGTSDDGGGAGGGTVNTSPTVSAAGPSATPTTELTVVVMGDYVSDTQFAQDLATNISSLVENKDVRLVASQTKE